jgi:hypothetical protein
MLSHPSFQVLIALTALAGTAYAQQDPPPPASATVLVAEKGENVEKLSGTVLRFTGGSKGEYMATCGSPVTADTCTTSFSEGEGYTCEGAPGCSWLLDTENKGVTPVK